MTTVNDFEMMRRLSRVMAQATSAERMTRLRDRRQRGYVIVTVRLDQSEMRKLVALGYLDPAQRHRGPALDAAAEAYFSDKLAEEPALLGAAL
jgi:hypothetical protein